MGWWDPEKVFAAAREQHRLWQLDYLCRSMAILNAAPILAERQTLFLNVDAEYSRRSGATELRLNFLSRSRASRRSYYF